MPHSPPHGPMLRRLLEAAGWQVHEVPGGWRASRSTPGPRLVAFLDEDLPAGFQRSFPSGDDPVLVLLGRSVSEHDRDRIEVAGARAVGPEELPDLLVGLLRTEAAPASPPEERAAGATIAPTPIAAPHEVSPPPFPPPVATASSPPVDTRDWDEGSPPLPKRPLLDPPDHQFPSDPTPFPPVVFEEERIVRPRLLREDLFHLGGTRWRGGQPRLVLVPFYLFAYALSEDGEDPSGPPRLVAVPGVGGPAQFWPSGEREIVAAVPHEHSRVRVRITPERGRALALEEVAERHATAEEHAEQRRGMLVIEHHRQKRGTEEVRMGAPALVWVPYWVVEAWNGRELIDAVTGATSPLRLSDEDAPL